MKKCRRILLFLPAAALCVVLAYLLYVMLAYHRLEDHLDLPVQSQQDALVQAETPYTIVSYNLGFGAYSADYSFFMDGGTESRAFSREAAEQNIQGAMEVVRAQAPDFALLQEVDLDATRSYHLDESALAAEALPDLAWVTAQNYDSPYLLWPLTQPHGASRAGMMTFSAFQIQSALRRSLPIETGFMKFLDLDRCYSVSRIPTANGRTLCLFHVHLSAYTSDGTIATEQLEILLADMAAERAAGNYVICGGDFNKDLLGNSGAIFGISGEDQTWAQPFPTGLLGDGISLVAPDPSVPSCRNADTPYVPGTTFVLTVDGFLTSDNVAVASMETLDTGFTWSDHNPVKMVFSLVEANDT